MSIELVMPSNHLILCRPLLFLLSTFPSVRVFYVKKQTNNNEKDHLIQTDVRISSNSALSVELSLTEQTKQQNTPLPINMTLLNQSWIFIGRTDAEAEAPILWPPDVKNWLIWKDPDDGKDWRWDKGMTEDEMVGWHLQLNGNDFE